jgi:sugar phosphate isomerase/epimerase
MQRIAETFREACNIAEGYGERLAAEGEICWGGMHGWKHMVELLELVDRPQTLGFQADMAHTMLYTLGYNSPREPVAACQNMTGPIEAILTDALRQVQMHCAPGPSTSMWRRTTEP